MQREDLLNLVEQYGSPLYVYDASKMKSQYERLTNGFKQIKNLRINYAVKALSNISVLHFLHSLGAEWIQFPSKKYEWP